MNMGLSCPLRISALVPQKSALFGRIYGHFWLSLFGQNGWILGSVHNDAKKEEVAQYQAILSLCLVNDAYIMTKDWDIILVLKTEVHKPHFFRRLLVMKRAFQEDCPNLPSTSESPDRKKSKLVNILFVCAEWNSRKGGLSTFNIEFAINLAKASRDNFVIHCFVSQSSESDREDAGKNGVNLITAKSVPGTHDHLEWLRLAPSELPHPDVVIGHGRKFGTPAYCIVQNTKCKWVQFVHVFCEDLGKYKQTDTNTQTDTVEENEKKHKQEIRLCEAANTVVAVGSLLQQKYSRCLPVTKVHIITPGILDKFVNLSDQKILANISHSPDEFSVFVFGRGSYEDLSLKGFDIIANELGFLGEKYKMTFVGSPEGQHRNIMDWFL